jgi:ParB-like chromosome segregation protein Spo0J
LRVESILIEDIIVGERRREDFGDLEGLAESINKYTLLQPIVVDGENNLVAGERRLRACRDVLGWSEIPARLFSELSEAERGEIELEENIRRKDLTEAERSKQTVSRAKTVAPLLSSVVEDKKPRGHQRQYEVPKKDVAQALGVSVGALVNSEKHVEALTKYPELSVVPTQTGAINAAKKLDAMPEGKRNEALSKIITDGKQAIAEITRKPSTSKPKVKPPSGKYAANLSQIQVFISSIKAVGAEELTASWSDQERRNFIANLRECRDDMTTLISDLEYVEVELQRAG